ncbi:MAG: cytidylyltransferase domain-containing protein, partial [Phycisphaerae bacterium]
MSATAIILGRAGSKGVPGKNVAAIAGKPCGVWTVDLAQASSSVSRVVVSTDDTTLAALARERGATVIERPVDLASDTARIDDAARHAEHTLKRGRTPSAATSPLEILYDKLPVRPRELRILTDKQRGDTAVRAALTLG